MAKVTMRSSRKVSVIDSEMAEENAGGCAYLLSIRYFMEE
jgi:hypothetical protein